MDKIVLSYVVATTIVWAIVVWLASEAAKVTSASVATLDWHGIAQVDGS